MKNSTKPSVLSKAGKLAMVAVIFSVAFLQTSAQIPPNAVNADPATRAISQVPLGSNIIGNGVLRFRFANEATSTNNTGQIPANSIRLTLSFPGVYAYNSVGSIPKFVVEDADTNPFGVVHLVNNALIQEGEVLDLELNVRAVSNGAGAVTFNSDRITPIIVANILTGNDNSSAVFTASVTLPVTLADFTAQKNNCTAKLNWHTVNETNIQHYIVEMSNDRGATYNPITTIAANNTGGDRNYDFNYQMSNDKAYFYRVKIVELTGNIHYSNVAIIYSGCGDVKNMQLYPTLATTEITLNVYDKSLLNSRAGIIDVMGRIHSNFIINTNTKRINITKLPAGVYILRLQDGSTAKFIKEQ